MHFHNVRLEPPCLSHHWLPCQSVSTQGSQGFLIVCCCAADPAGFLDSRSGVRGTLQGQCCCRRLRIAQLQVQSNQDPKMDDDNFFFFKKIGTWVGEVGGGVNADDRCDQ